MAEKLEFSWLRFWGDTMRGRCEEHTAYAASSPFHWDHQSRYNPPAGFVVIVSVEQVISSLDRDNEGQPYRGFAWHRYVNKRPAGEFRYGHKVQAVLMREFGEIIGDMAPDEVERVRLEIRLEAMRIRKEKQTQYMQNLRGVGRQIAAA